MPQAGGAAKIAASMQSHLQSDRRHRSVCAMQAQSLPRDLSAWLAHVQGQHPADIALGLERVREVAVRMGLARPARRVISVAGTNGKGSTVAFIEAIARAAGWRVGTYTSPHLRRYNERVRIDGVEAPDAVLCDAFEAVELARGGVPLTYFEYGTLAAFRVFAAADLDLAVLEVGMGGRLDAVNVVDPDVAVITTVDLDHQAFLGDDREAIGREKAGIMRPWRPVVLGERDPPSSVLQHAYRIGASAIRAGCDYLYGTDADGWYWREPGFELALPLPALAAPAQLDNAAAAIAALRALPGELPGPAWAAGVAGARLQGRLQSVQVDGVEVLLDVGHNPQAVDQLRQWLAMHPASGRTLAVFSALGDKDLPGLVRPLVPLVDAWWLAGLVADTPRGLEVGDLAQRLADEAGLAGAALAADVAGALRAACAAAARGDRILVYGSFFTVAAALEALGSG